VGPRAGRHRGAGVNGAGAEISGVAVVVTGGARGIGADIVRAFAQHGACVVACDRDGSIGDVAAAVNAGCGADLVVPMIGDVTSAETRDAIATSVDRSGLRLAALVNNAAAVMLQPAGTTTVDEFDRAIAINVRAAWQLTVALADRLAGPPPGAVVNLGSTHPRQTKRSSFPYNVTKGAVLALTKALAVDLGPRGIRVNSVSPGICDTEPTRRWIASLPDPDAARRSIVDDHPLGRLPTTSEVAAAVWFLCSDAASGISGTDLIVDAGRDALRR